MAVDNCIAFMLSHLCYNYGIKISRDLKIIINYY